MERGREEKNLQVFQTLINSHNEILKLNQFNAT